MRNHGPEQNIEYMRTDEDGGNSACCFLFLSR